ncbi:hypothetical protein DFH09DRAFT_1070294 [Mycena vulgaris]|nr:hypothetical protein DFH09DRAFT_1070294 [Mycena vulgaris]
MSIKAGAFLRRCPAPRGAVRTSDREGIADYESTAVGELRSCGVYAGARVWGDEYGATPTRGGDDPVRGRQSIVENEDAVPRVLGRGQRRDSAERSMKLPRCSSGIVGSRRRCVEPEMLERVEGYGHVIRAARLDTQLETGDANQSNLSCGRGVPSHPFCRRRRRWLVTRRGLELTDTCWRDAGSGTGMRGSETRLSRRGF